MTEMRDYIYTLRIIFLYIFLSSQVSPEKIEVVSLTNKHVQLMHGLMLSETNVL